MKSKYILGTTGLVIAAALLLGVNIVSSAGLRGAKLDLTENKIYTLTQGSRNIVKSLDEPIKLRFFYSEKLATANPVISDYATRVRELLEEYVSDSNGKLKLEVVDPEPFSEEEEAAVKAGIQGVPVSASDRLYFGLQGVNSTEGKETIPFFMPDKEDYLEYDVSQLIYSLAHPEKRKITILTDLPLDGNQNPYAAMMGQQDQGSAPWIIYQQLQKNYDASITNLTATEIPNDTDLLLVVHPKNISKQLEYAIDQYVIKGGKAIVMVDPLCEADKPPADPQNPMASMSAPKNSDLPEVLKAWGVQLVSGKVVGDREGAQQVMVGSRMQPEVVDYILYVSLHDDDINQKEYVTNQLQSINVITAGALEKVDGADTELTPLLQTSKDSELIDTSKVQMFPQPKDLLRDFKPEDKHQWIAVQVTGKVKSAFPDGPPPPEKKDGEETQPAPDKLDFVAESSGPIHAVVISDVDMLSDRAWVQIQQFFGQQIPNVIANNGQLLFNLVDHLSGSNDLISIRGRAGFTRPFTVVEKMEDDARAKSAEKMQDLQKELDDTKKRLTDLQKQAPEGNDMMIASSDVQKEIDQFQLKQLETERELRKLERSYRVDVERLGQSLKFINIGLIPILVGLIAVVLGAYRVSHRRRR